MAQASSTVRTNFVAAKTALDTLAASTRGDSDLREMVISAQRELRAAADVFHQRAVNDPNLRRSR